MKDYIDAIFSGNLVEAKKILENRINDIIQEKLDDIKFDVASKMFEEYDLDFDYFREIITEGNIQRIGRVKLIKARIRGGKVQRRKRLSAVKGYTIRGGRMIRMSARERLNRRMAARRAKYKIRAKRSQILRKRKISLRRRKAMGLR